jgi:diguanylate cyclase (GGDEF)-like protein/PAS domain S-box-containing protein
MAAGEQATADAAPGRPPGPGADLLAGSDELRGVLDEAAGRAAGLLGAAAVARLPPGVAGPHAVVAVAGLGDSDRTAVEEALAGPQAEDAWTALAAAACRPLSHDGRHPVRFDPPLPPAAAALLEHVPCPAVLAVTVPVPRGSTPGVLAVLCPRPFDGSDEVLVAEVARGVGRAVEHAQRVEALRREAAAFIDEALRARDERYRRIVQATPEPTAIHQGGRVAYANPAALRLVGATRLDEIVGRSLLDFVAPESLASVRRRALVARSDQVTPLSEERLVRLDGELVEVETVAVPTIWDGEPAVHVVARDVTASRRAEEQLVHQANHDALTGLPNRYLLLDRLGHALTRMARTKEGFALVLLDVDRFKLINEALGHEAGDHLLCSLAGDLVETVRPDDTVARLGGDEFVILLEDLPEAEVEEVTRRLLAEVARTRSVDGVELEVTASAGLVFGRHDATVRQLLTDADSAMYEAKAAGPGRFEWFNPARRERAGRRLRVEHDLRGAVLSGELRAWFQPEVELATGVLLGAEALVRWHRPDGEVLPPAAFLGVAEEIGMVAEIGDLMIDRACEALAGWHRAGAPPSVWVSVNLSAPELWDPRLVERVEAALARHGVAGANLCLEITEHSLVTEPLQAAHTVERLRALGVGVAVDDFGTGYSSLSYLTRFDPTYLKIDRSFVAGVADNHGDRTIVRASIDMAHALGITVVAEGIEDEEQEQALIALGCDLGQGYRYARPAATLDLPTLVSAGRRQGRRGRR